MIWFEDTARAFLESMAFSVTAQQQDSEWLRGYFLALATIAVVFELENASEYFKIANGSHTWPREICLTHRCIEKSR